MYLKVLRKTLQVVLVQLHDVFDELLDGDGVHVVCRTNTVSKVPIIVCVVCNTLVCYPPPSILKMGVHA